MLNNPLVCMSNIRLTFSVWITLKLWYIAICISYVKIYALTYVKYSYTTLE